LTHSGYFTHEVVNHGSGIEQRKSASQTDVITTV